ncbi:hypothetical protein EDEG_00805 [Edhazardia aedis USNM 41457]|uniref:Thioredoxin domain-containing protein n=1 Tax=Edhazardia aedis (strain USNM 41457) TaxID=1003232 RepID=J9DUZ8_EDHAE|nr:hypothetical protein EDEG_00805 [Edhazardia aedis USNM 41457]|eukprot:EJW05092.1 hypothetical protein EDEG_00805 [Edhazardia aedis USNM 41457]
MIIYKNITKVSELRPTIDEYNKSILLFFQMPGDKNSEYLNGLLKRFKHRRKLIICNIVCSESNDLVNFFDIRCFPVLIVLDRSCNVVKRYKGSFDQLRLKWFLEMYAIDYVVINGEERLKNLEDGTLKDSPRFLTDELE